MTDLRLLPPLDIAAFITPEIHLTEKVTSLPNMGPYLEEPSFAEVKIGLKKRGLAFKVEVHQPFKNSFFPDVEKGDGFELFIDTRDSSSTFLGRYSHHFIFLPKEVDGRSASEVTRFKTHDRHPLASIEDLEVKSHFTLKGYSMDIYISENSLFGYDPSEYRRLKLAYILHRGGESPMHFPVSQESYRLREFPLLWAPCIIHEGYNKNEGDRFA